MNKAPIGNHVFPTSVAGVLRIVPLSRNHFVASEVSDVPRRTLYGGQVAAQALRAASLSVGDERIAHSVHGYFLEAGDASEPVIFRVEETRDGRRYSVRDVTASQGASGDRLIFKMTCSFSRPKDGAEFQAAMMPDVAAPKDCPPYVLNAQRTFDLEARMTEDLGERRWPARMWLRLREPLPSNPNLNACGLLFLSDMSTGLSLAPDVDKAGLLPSLDHAVWLHRVAPPTEWLLLDLLPEATGAGRGVYTGHIFDEAGNLIASLAQESLFDIHRRGR